jgi:amino acid adenylation domain-containing protein
MQQKPGLKLEEVAGEWNKNERQHPSDVCVHEMFERQAHLDNTSIAVSFKDENVTYGELNARSNQLAQYLRARGVGPNVLVGLCMERSLQMLIGLLGILKAGGTYVPLDPALPPERIAYLLEDSKVSLLLTQQQLTSRLPASQAEIVPIDSRSSLIEAHSSENLATISTPEDLAYTIYTSGSTGTPKGVCLPHQALSNLLCWQLQQSKAGRGDRTLQFTSLSFDVSFQEIFATWCSGGVLVLIADDVRRNSALLIRFLEQQKIMRLFLPFVALQQLAAAAEGGFVPGELREVITAGEQLRITPQIRAFFSRMPRCRLFNHYGPSETHVVTAYSIPASPDKWDLLPPIGKPISNTEVHILDMSLKPVPVGDLGELYIGGVGLARGYHNRPELTAERFVLVSVAGESETRLYKTGDYCRSLPDGNIQYVGRMDGQVKIRGYRVELGEIESVLGSHRGVRQCVVVVRDESGDKRLVAYFVPSTEQQPSARLLRDFLKTKFPDYMIPAAFINLEALPLTPNGKVDRRSLPAPSRESSAIEVEYIPPTDELERKLVSIWESVLKISPIGIADNIFDLGVDSLLAAELFARIEKTIGKNLPPAPLFQAPTVQTLAALLRKSENQQGLTSLVTIQPGGSKTPFFCVHGGAGTVLLFNSLARHLAPERPVYGLQARGLYGRDLPHDNVEEMAAHYVKEMRVVQAHGPYLLGGWCFGGVVAYEIAQQLRRMGETVDALVMFDAPSSPDHYPPKTDATGLEVADSQRTPPQSRWRQFCSLSSRGKFDYISRRVVDRMVRTTRLLYRSVRGISRRLLCRIYILLRQPLPDNIRNYYFLYINTIAEMKYRPKPYSGDMVVFRSQGPYPDPNLGWSRFVSGAIASHEIQVNTAHHRALMQEPAVLTVIEILKRYLAGKSGMPTSPPQAGMEEVLSRVPRAVSDSNAIG